MLATISRVIVEVVGGASMGVVAGDAAGVAAVGGGSKAVVGAGVGAGVADSPQTAAPRTISAVSKHKRPAWRIIFISITPYYKFCPIQVDYDSGSRFGV